LTRPFVLASQSPARRELLKAAGIEPQVIVSGVDESQVMGHDPAELAATLAEMKANAVLNLVGPDSLVLGCDSVLHFGHEILGKPEGPEEATSRWKRMRGRSGTLYTGHCLIDVAADRQIVRSAGTEVHFAEVSDGGAAACGGFVHARRLRFGVHRPHRRRPGYGDRPFDAVAAQHAR
jgi:septum formation protein